MYFSEAIDTQQNLFLPGEINSGKFSTLVSLCFSFKKKNDFNKNFQKEKNSICVYFSVVKNSLVTTSSLALIYTSKHKCQLLRFFLKAKIYFYTGKII